VEIFRIFACCLLEIESTIGMISSHNVVAPNKFSLLQESRNGLTLRSVVCGVVWTDSRERAPHKSRSSR